MVAAKYERTAPEFATEGPPEGGTWNEYFTELKAINTGVFTEHIDEDGIRHVTRVEVDDSDDEGIVRVTVPQHEITLSASTEMGVPSTVMAYRNLLLKHGWEFKMGHCQSFAEGKVYGPTAQKAGQKRDDKHTDVYWINARKVGKGYVDLSYHVVNGVSKPMTRMINKQLVTTSDKELKDWIKT